MVCLINAFQPVTVPQQLITAGTRRDCVRLRGLPYEAQVEHILEFLGDHAKNIIYQGVHMVFNSQVSLHFALCALCRCDTDTYVGSQLCVDRGGGESEFAQSQTAVFAHSLKALLLLKALKRTALIFNKLFRCFLVQIICSIKFAECVR